MDLIKLIDVAGPKKIKDTLNILIENYENFGDRVQTIADKAATDSAAALTAGNEAKQIAQETQCSLEQSIAAQDTRIAEAVEAQELRLDTAIAAQDAVVSQSATDAANAKQVAEEALAIIEQADARSEEAALLAEQAEQTASEAVSTSELAMNVATEAKSTVDQAVSTGVFGTFVHNPAGISLLHAYMTDDILQEDAEDREYLATPKLVRDALANYVKNTDYASFNDAGVVKINANEGIGIGNTTKMLYISPATQTEISAKTSTRKPLVPNTLDYAVKVGVTTNINVLTDDEKTAAQTWLGVSEKYATLATAQTALQNTVNALSNAVTDIDVGLNVVDNHLNQVQANINEVNNKIPSTASATNQLADKDFVNSSVSTATATFRGTVDSVASLPTTGVDINDYAFVRATDSAGNTLYQRYKYNGSQWVFEYELNNSSFTAEQWATINSGLTKDYVDSFVKKSGDTMTGGLQFQYGDDYSNLIYINWGHILFKSSNSGNYIMGDTLSDGNFRIDSNNQDTEKTFSVNNFNTIDFTNTGAVLVPDVAIS